jgi:hypothetical protein
MHTKFKSVNLKGRDHWGDLGVDGMKIKGDIKENMVCSVDWCEEVTVHSQ